MSKYIKIKELEKLTNCKIKDIKELQSGHTYLIGIEVGDMPKEIITQVFKDFNKQFELMGIKVVLYPRRKDIAELTVYELEPTVNNLNPEDVL